MGVAMVLLLCAMYFVAVNGLRLMKKIGPSGNAIVNKLVAFLTFCIGIQILVTGIAKIFHLTVL
jgi:small neutral amino acid transporter SnatA (MarC family)